MRDRELEKVKVAVFIGTNAAFLGCLLCGINFKWTKEVETAGVTETSFYWNPDWFDSLMFEERKGVLLHELWHIALLHGARMGVRDPELWNIACDIRINNNLLDDGITLPKDALSDPTFGKEWSEEAIYDSLNKLVSIAGMPKPQPWGTSVAKTTDKTITLVKTAVATAKLAGSEPGNISSYLKDFLRPKLPWKVILRRYLLEAFNKEYSLSRPNRRFSDIYLPSLQDSSGRLVNIAMYLDTSCSISEEEIKRFITEVKFVKEHLNPKELRVVQFDTKIQEETVYNESSNLNKFEVKGFGGTSFKCVHDHILKHKPALSIIFSDLYADPMESIGLLKVIWVSSSKLKGPFGVTIHV